jgi:hypothetical protein
MQVLQIIGFLGVNADPCMMVRKNNHNIVFIAIWVDNSLLIGHCKSIENTFEDLKANGFGLKIEGDLDDYLSCEITFSRDNKIDQKEVWTFGEGLTELQDTWYPWRFDFEESNHKD